MDFKLSNPENIYCGFKVRIFINNFKTPECMSELFDFKIKNLG